MGFVGLGNMGLSMAKNMLAAGYKVQAYDLNEQAMKEIEQAGAVITEKAGHVAKDVSALTAG